MIGSSEVHLVLLDQLKCCWAVLMASIHHVDLYLHRELARALASRPQFKLTNSLLSRACDTAAHAARIGDSLSDLLLHHNISAMV